MCVGFRSYDVGPRGPFRLPIGIIPDTLFSIAYSLLACLPLLVGVLFSCDDTNMLARGFPLHRIIPTAILVGLILGAFDWLAGRQHGGSASLRSGVRMAVAFTATLAGATPLFGNDMWSAGGGIRAWGYAMLHRHNTAVCNKTTWFLSMSFTYYVYLFWTFLDCLPYCLLHGERVHQATREALLQLRHHHAASGGGGGASLRATCRST